MSASFSLRFEELDVLLDELGLPRWLYPFDIKSPSKTLDERAKQRERTWQRLRADALADRHGLRSDQAVVLRAWAEPDVLLTHIAGLIDEPTDYRYRAGWRGGTGFVTFQQHDTVVFEPQRPEHVIDELVDKLPDYPPVSLPSATIVTEPHPGAPAEVPIHDEDPPPTSGPAERAAADRFFAAPLLRYGRITCSIPGPRRDELLGNPKWFDTENGRFMLVTEPLPGGAERTTIAPTDKPRLARWLRDHIEAR